MVASEPELAELRTWYSKKQGYEISKAVVQQLLTMDAVVYSIRERHPEVFGGSLWRDLLLALDALRVDVGTRA